MLSYQFTETNGIKFNSDSEKVFNTPTHWKVFDAFTKLRPSINFISLVEKRHELIVQDFVSRFMKPESSSTFSSTTEYARNSINFIIIHSLNSFKRISSLPTKRLDDIKVIIWIQESSKNVLRVMEIFEKFRSTNIIEVYIIYEENRRIIVMTFKPYSTKNCWTLPVTVGNFSLKDLVPEDFIYTPEPLTNFFKCPLRFGAYLDKPYLFCHNVTCNWEDYIGRDANLMKTLSKALNSSVQLEFFSVREAISSLSKTNASDVIIGDFFLRHERVQEVASSIPYFLSEVGFVIPSGRPFHPLESFLKPFQTSVWICLGVTFMALFIFIFVTGKTTSKNVQNLVFGKLISSPAMNFIAVAFGVPQNRLPSMNFARFLLMCFIMFCVVMRSVYQGSLYRFLQSNMDQKAIETIDEMVKEDFSFYTFEANSNFLWEGGIKNSSIVSIESLNFEIMEKLKEPTFKGSFLRSKPKLMYLNHVNRYNYTYEFCQQRLINMPVVLYFQKASFLVEIVNDKLYQIISAGLIEHWDKEHSKKIVRSNKTEPKVLRMSHLKGIFQIWFAMCFLSFLLFIVEKIKFRLKK